MTKSINKGYSVTGVGTANLAYAAYTWATVFRVKSRTPDEAVLVNLSSPIDRVEKVRIGYKEIKDVYLGTDINSAYQPASKKGFQLLLQSSDTWTQLDDAAPTLRVDIPVSCHIVIKSGYCDTITTADLVELIGRAVGTLYDGGASRLPELTKGVLIPSSL